MIADVTRSLGTDYYLLDELFTDEEREIRDRVRAFADAEVIPIINEYWEKALTRSRISRSSSVNSSSSR